MNYKLFEEHFVNHDWEMIKGDHDTSTYIFTKGEFKLKLRTTPKWEVSNAQLEWRGKILGEWMGGTHVYTRQFIRNWADEIREDRLSCIATIGDVTEVMNNKVSDKLSRDKFLELYVSHLRFNYAQDENDFCDLIMAGERQYQLYLNK